MGRAVLSIGQNQERQGISRKLIMKGKVLLRPMMQVTTP